jgi:hypothetical protein
MTKKNDPIQERDQNHMIDRSRAPILPSPVQNSKHQYYHSFMLLQLVLSKLTSTNTTTDHMRRRISRRGKSERIRIDFQEV